MRGRHLGRPAVSDALSVTVSWGSLVIGEVPARLYRPVESWQGWLVWVHGGSWTRGSVAGWHEVCADLARLTGSTVVSVDYRLAPLHPHPAALEDVLAVLEWVAVQAGDDQVAVGGDSAGGTIAGCAALAWRDQGRQLAAQVLAYPPMDPECRASSYKPSVFPTREDLMTSWRAYLGSGDGAGYSTPFQADDLSGTAPAWLVVGEHDPVRDDVEEYAMRLLSDGVAVRLEVLPGVPHGAILAPGPMRDWIGSAFLELSSSKEMS
ncbi:alpha/beta hydrolase [Kribbella qitaiheensis]|uniref:Alpha/beta hydrolase n=1 Tax=Kribbella qitaiheensis TaxID=1544730 RepID=A0A7G6X4L5_9ACTN|nr:alpha/beta hydrolase [Kribbella qitaiheensis]QNE21180.1 alpha/beta hydrolase [Kribbella qitaiheensis]